MSSEVDYIAAKTFGFNGQKQMGFNPKGGFSEDEFYKSRRNFELLSNLVFRGLNQAATWSDFVTSIPSLNFTPVMTFAR